MTQKEALQILKTGVNVFLTGEPGSGKTYTINEYVWYLRQAGIEVAITASTGIAATHLGGMTIHLWSGIGIRRDLDKYDLDRISNNEYVAKRIRRAKVLIIDEISMLLPNMLTMVDAICKEVKQNREPFGGLQVIFVGDFFQLPPIVKKNTDEDPQIALIELNQADFAYDSPAWLEANPVVCYLSEQYRQDDSVFLKILSAIRSDTFGEEHLVSISKRKVSSNSLPVNIPKLFSHNMDVDMVNQERLEKIKGAKQSFVVISDGPPALVAVLKKGCLSPETLTLKKGAEIMFTKNNLKEGFVNGTLGIVTGFGGLNGYPIVETRDGKSIIVEPMEWSVEENGKICARITQVPLRLAWAITVHKSQGMSIDAAVMDLSQVFEYGQGYVALSRVRRLSGLYILGWNAMAFKVHPDIIAKDGEFRNVSLEAEKAFLDIHTEELEKMHSNFITAFGGKITTRKKMGKKDQISLKNGFEKIREKYPNAYRRWSPEEDKKLKELFNKNFTILKLMETFGRKRGGIQARLEKMGLVDG